VRGPLRTIVVGYDGTGPAERALARAAELAEALGAQLVVVSVGPLLPLGASSGTDPMPVPIPPLTVEAGGLPEGREAAERDLERARAALAGRSLQVDYVATAGDPAEELIEAADARDAELIVVGTREPGFLDRLVGGSVSQDVARSAHRDVLIVHPGHEPGPGSG
jgi:nucleotide-binding universal stress UspA family protein